MVTLGGGCYRTSKASAWVRFDVGPGFRVPVPELGDGDFELWLDNRCVLRGHGIATVPSLGTVEESEEWTLVTIEPSGCSSPCARRDPSSAAS